MKPKIGWALVDKNGKLECSWTGRFHIHKTRKEARLNTMSEWCNIIKIEIREVRK